ncbi:delta(1)-pyrroline-2-carboxylate reductase family protein [Cupriavidus metallidurans]|jgi:ornithine cyclodeaminase/alanine dehydrogenase-like protein (mu-crystallin family)|uniref:Ornithine cyclodeaminase n=1 Tax=Cupriavidus metallidurans (strain ATCC 43123 / DSM 2839 / NBRC 102507 / CH34) TaxID=266264 RepID=Q1LHH7_CUPMC|nr:delta(1)-pyrroline-2-carboxylate reductase family protein [Cupriavidus metallidurans]ABF10399.1 ornithine cyclodeaminase [Cupriavidus metallidurans CH34]KWW33778.1 Delta(1)-pyrroline-2-carboxylate reductase 1 [Cupriavidus metallidurans]QGS28834.1 delta(1)-pyrroline-2-carboxylate reductase family protein [Cupriavidus metallidurans]
MTAPAASFVPLDAAATAARLPYPELAQAIAAMLAELRDGTAMAPPRIALPVGDAERGHGTLLVMPARNRDIVMTKNITVHPDNPQRGLPNILGEVVVANAHTGERIALLDGPTVTGRRTAAVSLLAAQSFAPVPDGELLIVGAGVQAQTHLEAFVAGLPVRKVWLHSRTRDKAEALAEHAGRLGVSATVIDDVAEVLPRVSMVVTVTSSRTPVLPDLDSGLWTDRHFIAAVGAFRPEMCELPPRLCHAAAASGRLLADTLFGIEDEAGDLLQAGIDWQTVQPFETAILEADALRARTGSPLVFKSVGYALWDLAACALASKK